MARSVRGLPESFSLDLPEEKPVVIGDFLDEDVPPTPVRKVQKPRPEMDRVAPTSELRVTSEPVAARPETPVQLPVLRSQPSVIRYQLNLNPKAKVMFDELIEHIREYSPQADASASEIFQGMVTVLHGVINELELSTLPRRGSWGSVTARNFPGALSDVFEKAIVSGARKRGRT